MPTILTETAYPSDWLKFEADNYYSRDTLVVATGSGKVLSGTPIAKVAATGKYVPAVATGSDGSQTAVGVLFEDVDATSADAKGVGIMRHATVNHAGLVRDPSINDASKRAAQNGQLAAVGVLVREGA